MHEDDAVKKIKGPIAQRLSCLACWDLPTLEFTATLHKGNECGNPIWKVKSLPSTWVAEIRREVRALAEGLGFEVQGLIEPEDEVHITIRGRWKNSAMCPAPPQDQSNFHMTFHKLGFRRRFELGTGRSESFGGTLAVNFGVSTHVTRGGPSVRDIDIADDVAWPPLSRRDPPIRARAPPASVAGQPSILMLAEGTHLPLDDDTEVAVAASLLEADLAAAPHNAQVS